MDNLFIFNMKLSGFMPYYKPLLWSILLVEEQKKRRKKKQ